MDVSKLNEVFELCFIYPHVLIKHKFYKILTLIRL